MLSDAEIEKLAATHIQRFGNDLRLSRPVQLTDPLAVFYKVERPETGSSTTLVSPFVVLREDGRIVSISANMVMPGIITKLWGWQAIRADPALMKAIVDPDFDVPRHVEVWSAIAKEVMNELNAK
jgi:hypothetical protein